MNRLLVLGATIWVAPFCDTYDIEDETNGVTNHNFCELFG